MKLSNEVIKASCNKYGVYKSHSIGTENYYKSNTFTSFKNIKMYLQPSGNDWVLFMPEEY